jgi:plastocyanin
MRLKAKSFFPLLCGVVLSGCLIRQAHALGTEVVAQAQVKLAKAAQSVERQSNEGVVMWLTRVETDPMDPLPPITPRNHLQLAQKNKQFVPHMLVVPVGSVVDFPNLDPFFHNVFSRFDGKKFDLGLYESGSSRSVHFDRAGVSYIFCNIHPEMSAVVVAVPTPYFASSSSSGSLVIHDVEPGTYDVHVWAMGSPEKSLAALRHRISVSGRTVDLGAIALDVAGMPPHKNKFGEDYDKKPPVDY